jgi:NADH-ubiquinone oxidoreductase chain 5
MLGWDGLGVVSFLLIVYYINHERINNGLFTLFQNRLGDLFFVLFLIGVVRIRM